MLSKLLLAAPLVALLLAAVPAPSEDKKKKAEDDFKEFTELPKEAKAILDQAEQIDLYSLDPAGGMLKKDAEKDGFHGWKVLGKTKLADAKERKKVMAALHKGIAAGFGPAGCFHPRHGIRATLKDKTVDLVICFECGSMGVYHGEKGSVVWTGPSPQPKLDAVLEAAKVRTPPKPQ